MRVLLISALALLSGCSWLPERPCDCVDSIRMIERKPPAVLLGDCPSPLPPDTISALTAARFIVEQRRVIARCNADKSALREFYAD